MASSTAQTTAVPGTTDTLSNTAKPTTAPHRSAPVQRAAHAAENSPQTTASIAGHPPKNVLLEWKPDSTQCMPPDADATTSTDAAAAPCARWSRPTERANRSAPQGRSTSRPTATAASWPWNGWVRRSQACPSGG